MQDPARASCAACQHHWPTSEALVTLVQYDIRMLVLHRASLTLRSCWATQASAGAPSDQSTSMLRCTSWPAYSSWISCNVGYNLFPACLEAYCPAHAGLDADASTTWRHLPASYLLQLFKPAGQMSFCISRVKYQDACCSKAA